MHCIVFRQQHVARHNSRPGNGYCHSTFSYRLRRGKADNPGSVTPAQCAGASCGTQGAPTPSASTATLCPDIADLVNSTYLGGAGSGEIVQLNIDATAMTYTLKWLESPIPLTSASVSVTRRGTQITGAVIHPPIGILPTAEQTRCAFILGAGTGTASDGTTYTTPDFVDNPNPPMILIGKGVADGGIPGATIQYAGIALLPGVPAIGAVNKRHFDFYPFLGFASMTTDITKLAGTYNAAVPPVADRELRNRRYERRRNLRRDVDGRIHRRGRPNGPLQIA
ncbi:hypothetical protein OKW35_002088 [Paraburkholderia sp. MM5477-R1]